MSRENDSNLEFEEDQIKKYFDSATYFYRTNAQKIENKDVHLKFYGLYKVINEGPISRNFIKDYIMLDKKRKAHVDSSVYGRKEAMLKYCEILEKLNIGWSKKNYDLFVKPVIKPSKMANEVIKHNTPLENFIEAVRKGKVKEVLNIAENEKNILYKTDGTGGNALHWAADSDQDKIIKVLMNLKFFVDSQDNQGQTPIHIAAYCENFKAVRELLRCGASLHIPDHDGETPLDVFNEDPNLLRCLELYEFYPISTLH